MPKELTTAQIYTEDMKVVEKNKSIPQEPTRDSLHRLIVAGKLAIENAKDAGAREA